MKKPSLRNKNGKYWDVSISKQRGKGTRIRQKIDYSQKPSMCLVTKYDADGNIQEQYEFLDRGKR